MNKITVLKKSIFTLSLLLLIVSCKNEKNETEKTEDTESEIVTTTEDIKKNIIGNGVFDSNSTGYDTTTGKYERKIWIPSKTLTINGRSTLLKPSLRKQYDYSVNGIPIIFELYQHKENNKDILKFNLENKQLDGDLSILTNYKPSDAKDVLLISYHDEDYLKYSDTIKNNIKTYIQQTIIRCKSVEGFRCYSNVLEIEILKIIDSTLVDKNRPNTVGGGVIPPK